VVLRPLGNVVYLLPPYCTTDAELVLLYTVLRRMRELVLDFTPAPNLPEILHD
jgi:adenosylmethionine-8-amino-7-oxononanoate aminotransferase